MHEVCIPHRIPRAWEQQGRRKRKKRTGSSADNYYYFHIPGLRVFSRCEDVAKYKNTRETSSMDCRERGTHARGVYPIQYTSYMETARVKEQTRE